MSDTFFQPAWKLRKFHYLLEHYGSYEAMRSAGRYDWKQGVWIVPTPHTVQEAIDADPLCHPPTPPESLCKRLLQKVFAS